MSRVASVAATGTQVSAEKWCDVSYTDENAPKLELPAAVSARGDQAMPVAPADRWVWLNMWATWCGPCKQEMPLLVRWNDQMRKEGSDFDLWFMSLDESQEELGTYLKAHPETAPGTSLRMTGMSQLEPWLKKYQLDASAAIPIQVLAAPGGKVRCVRVGSLRDSDYRVVKAMLK